MFLIESFKSSSFRMTLPFVVHNSSVFAFLGFFNASAAKALPETMILQQPASWMTGIAVLRVHRIDFFPMQRTSFPQFSLQHWKEHRGKNSRNCRKMMKNAQSWNLQGVLGGWFTLFLLHLPSWAATRPPANEEIDLAANMSVNMVSRLPCVHTLRIFRFYFSCAWSEAFGTLQWPPSRFWGVLSGCHLSSSCFQAAALCHGFVSLAPGCCKSHWKRPFLLISSASAAPASALVSWGTLLQSAHHLHSRVWALPPSHLDTKRHLFRVAAGVQSSCCISNLLCPASCESSLWASAWKTAEGRGCLSCPPGCCIGNTLLTSEFIPQ